MRSSRPRKALTVAKGLLVPKINERDTMDLASIHWILVVEKEVDGCFLRKEAR
jgi:hypothetical protein